MAGRVKRMAFALALVSIGFAAIVAVAQTRSSGGSAAPYQPAVPNAPQVYGGGYGGGYYSPGTAAGAGLQGMASLASAAGSRNLSNSAAAVNMTQAQKQEIQNYSEGVNTYFEMRQVNAKARAAERGPNLSQAELNRLAQEAAPKPISNRMLDPVEGTISWPDLLQDDKFADQRALLNKAFGWRAHYGTFNFEQLGKVEEATNAMLRELRNMVRDADPMEYTQAKGFVQSLAYEARKPTS